MSAEKRWDEIKGRYLGEIEKALSHADGMARRRVLSDVSDHLEQRLAELGPEQRTCDRLMGIVADMGPADEYAGLLLEEMPARGVSHKAKWLMVIAAAAGFVVLCVLLSPAVKRLFEVRGMTAEQVSHRAWQAWRSGEYQRAEKNFETAVSKEARLASAWNGLGWSRFHLGKFAAAKMAFDECVRIDERFSGAWNGLGYIASAEGDVDRAIECWKKTIAISPAATSSFAGLAQAYMTMQRYEEAAVTYEQWLSVEPDEPTARAGLEEARRKGTGD